MTPINLIHCLAEDISRELEGFKLPAEYQADKKVSVYEQHLPTEMFEDDTFYPLVLVTLKSVDFDGEDSRATVMITVGVYGGERDDGWRDMMNIAERIRQFLLMRPVIGRKFPFIAPLVFEPLDEQPAPFFFGNIAARYRVGTLQQISN